jgi:hypothetical protein
VAYYEQKKPGLGLELLAEVRRAYDVVSVTPNRWPSVGRGARRYRLDRFPYGVVYVPANDTVLIVSVMHLSRRPGYWRGRLPRPSPAERAGSRA